MRMNALLLAFLIALVGFEKYNRNIDTDQISKTRNINVRNSNTSVKDIDKNTAESVECLKNGRFACKSRISDKQIFGILKFLSSFGKNKASLKQEEDFFRFIMKYPFYYTRAGRRYSINSERDAFKIFQTNRSRLVSCKFDDTILDRFTESERDSGIMLDLGSLWIVTGIGGKPKLASIDFDSICGNRR